MIVFVVQSDETNQRQIFNRKKKTCPTICVNSGYMVTAPTSGIGPSF